MGSSLKISTLSNCLIVKYPHWKRCIIPSYHTGITSENIPSNTVGESHLGEFSEPYKIQRGCPLGCSHCLLHQITIPTLSCRYTPYNLSLYTFKDNFPA